MVGQGSCAAPSRLDGYGVRNADEVVGVVRNIFERETPRSNRFIRQMFPRYPNCQLVVLVGAVLQILFIHTAWGEQAYSRNES